MLTLEWKDKKSGVLQVVQFDVVTNETHEALMTITEHPVEEGTDVVDNARPKPMKLTIEGFVSNKPLWSNPGVELLSEYIPINLEIPKPIRKKRPSRVKLEIPKPSLKLNVASLVTAGIGALVDLIKGGTYATLAPEPPAAGSVKATLLAPKDVYPDRAAAMHQVLLAGQIDRALVKVTSKMGQIENMLIEKVSVPRTVETGNGADFTVDLTQIRIVKSETVDAPVPAEKRGEKSKSLGSQAAKDSKKDEKHEKVAASFVKQGLNITGLAREGSGLNPGVAPLGGSLP